MMRRRILFLFWLLLAAISSARAASPSITAALTSSETTLGAPVQLEVKIKGATDAGPPQDINVDGLEIHLTNQERSYQMRNFSVQSELTFAYTILATKTGTFKIPPQSIRVGNSDLTTPELTLQVADSGNRSAAPAPGNPSSSSPTATANNQLWFAELVVPKNEAYLGEIIPVVVRIGVNARTPLKGMESPNLKAQGFTMQKLGDGNQNVETIGGRPYNVYSFKTAIAATRPGKLEFGPVETKAVVLVPRQRSSSRRSPFDPFGDNDPFSDPFFRDPFGAFVEQKEIAIKSQPVPLEIKPLPPGAPPTFAGAVGKFSMTAEANPKRVQTGDPITIKTNIAGHGNFDRVSAPALSDANGWHTYPPSANFNRDDDVGMSGTKTFEEVISPNEKKVSVPPLLFTYFDPSKQTYVTLKSEAVPITVEGVAVAQTAPAPAAAPSATPEPKPQDILHQITERGAIARSFAPIYVRKEFWLAQIIPALLALGIAAGKASARRRANKEGLQKAQWEREAEELLRKLRRDETPQYFADASRVVQLKTALKQNVEPATVSADSAARAFALGPQETANMQRLFASSDEFRYSGSANGGGSAISAETRRETQTFLESL